MKIKTRAGEEACSWHTKTKKQCGIQLGQPRLVSKTLGNFPTENKQQKSLITHFWKCIAIDERGLSNANVLMPSRAAVWVPQQTGPTRRVKTQYVHNHAKQKARKSR